MVINWGPYYPPVRILEEICINFHYLFGYGLLERFQREILPCAFWLGYEVIEINCTRKKPWWMALAMSWSDIFPYSVDNFVEAAFDEC